MCPLQLQPQPPPPQTMAFASGTYPCLNPAAQCVPYPSVDDLNTAMGCFALNGGCIPTQCPSFQCGDSCPAACPEDVDDCTTWWAQQKDPPTHPCSTFYVSYMQRVLKRTPMTGCAGPCEGGEHDGESTCCSGYTYDETQVRPWDLSGTVDSSWIKDGALVGDPLAYENYLNYITGCLQSTCNCPSQPPTSGASHLQPCSGHGTCQFEGASGQSRADPANWFCACDGDYTGVDCGTLSGDVKGCPKGWDEGEHALVPCSGPAKGTCNTETGACTCTPGWGGLNCSVQTCPVDAEGNICSGNGKCTWLNTCDCQTGFSGPACNCSVGADGKVVCTSTAGGSGSGGTTPGASGDSTVTSIPASSVVAQKRREANIVHAIVAIAISVFLGYAVWHLMSRRAVATAVATQPTTASPLVPR